MDTLALKTETSQQALLCTLALINGGFKATKAKIKYNVSKGLPPMCMEDSYPLILEGYIHKIPTTIKVYGVTAGYNGEGPRALVNILKAAGFVLNYGPILTKSGTHNSKIDITCFPHGEMHDNLSEVRHPSQFLALTNFSPASASLKWRGAFSIYIIFYNFPYQLFLQKLSIFLLLNK